jgi:hypothetical protein
MTAHQTSRTLVKSAPELWAECSDAASLARHLGAFGEIRITKLEPETAVAWEGPAASGTVRLETSGWGTRVTLTVTRAEATVVESPPAAVPETPDDPGAPPVAQTQDDPPDEEAPLGEPSPHVGMLARFMLMLRRRPALEPVLDDEPASVAEPEPEPEPEPAPEPVARAEPSTASAPEPAAEEALVAALDSLGRAHHRPYSRA